MDRVLTYRLDGDTVVQTDTDDEVTRFDPKTWGTFLRGSLVVHAVRIPRRFKVGADICRDGYVVFDGTRIYATDAGDFGRVYEPLFAQAA